jgi:hypothetical protein
MNRPRVPLGLEATRATLNRAACLHAGQALAEARREQDLSIQMVGSRLLLSPTQVAALEEVNADAFYSAEFYASALKKYAALLGVALDQIDRVIVGPERPDTGPAIGFKRGRRSAEAPLVPVRPRKTAIAAAAVFVGALASWPIVSSFRSTPARVTMATASGPSDVRTAETRSVEPVVSPTLTAPISEPKMVEAVDTPAAPVRQDERAAAVPLADTASSADVFGRVRAETPTWVFVRYANNATAERGLAAGDEFVLRERPTYLAVGSAESVHVEISGREIDTAAFAANGQLRIGSSSLARLVQRTPSLP